MISGIKRDYQTEIPEGDEFTDVVLKDESGGHVVNAAVHREFHLFVQECKERKIDRILILGAFGLGKTEQISIGYVLERIAKNVNIRIKMVSNTDENATDRVRAIKNYIENDDDFKSLAPHVRKTPVWGNSKFIIARPSLSKDGTVEAYGLFGSAIGGRADLIIFDDPQDLKTAVLEPSSREKCIEILENVWLSRLVEDGMAIVLCNRWHEKDISAHIMTNPKWAWMSIAVAEDYKKLEVIKYIEGKKEFYKIHPWKDSSYFMSKRMDLGERGYNRGFRLIPYSDDEMFFPSFVKCCRYNSDRKYEIERLMKKRGDFLVISGIDYASKKRPGTVMSTVFVNKKTEKRYFADVVALREQARLVEHIVRVRKEYNVDLFMAENNATQENITELIQEFSGVKGAIIKGFCTGKNKADPDTGLVSLEKEFENYMWDFYFDSRPKVEDEKFDVYSRLFYEIKEYPFWTTQDIVMSLWFAREGINFLIRKTLRPRLY